jgi:hypothetical protein
MQNPTPEQSLVLLRRQQRGHTLPWLNSAMRFPAVRGYDRRSLKAGQMESLGRPNSRVTAPAVQRQLNLKRKMGGLDRRRIFCGAGTWGLRGFPVGFHPLRTS